MRKRFSLVICLLNNFDDFLKKYKHSKLFFEFNMSLINILTTFTIRFYWLRHPVKKIKLIKALKRLD